MIKVVSLFLSFVLTFLSTGCIPAGSRTGDLMKGIEPSKETPTMSITEHGAEALMDFTVRLFQECENGDNVMVSPYSVLCAMGMTANGASGETLSQMQKTFGISADELNFFVAALREKMPSDKKCKFSQANSIWFSDSEDFTPNRVFLQKNADYFRADIYKKPFNDATCSEINGWVSDKTDGMIKKILDGLSPEMVMVLINALAFEAEWKDKYEKSDVRDGVFTKENGEEQQVKLMHSTEGLYLSDDNAKGFVKDYVGGKYAFAALLPDEGVSVSDYVASLSGEKLYNILKNAEADEVITATPKFKSDYTTILNDKLASMGITDAFDERRADFSRLGEAPDNIYIGSVIHKTFIEVDEKGTKAAAVTAVTMETCSAAPVFNEPKRVILDRPFVYMIIDTETNVPMFIGTTMAV